MLPVLILLYPYVYYNNLFLLNEDPLIYGEEDCFATLSTVTLKTCFSQSVYFPGGWEWKSVKTFFNRHLMPLKSNGMYIP